MWYHSFMKTQKLPVIKNIKKKKMLNVKKIIQLAKKVRKSFEEEGRLPDPDNPDGNKTSAGIYFSR